MTSTSHLKAILVAMIALIIPVIAGVYPFPYFIGNVISSLNQADSKSYLTGLSNLRFWMPESIEVNEHIGITADTEGDNNTAIIHLLPGYQAERLSLSGYYALGNSYFKTNLQDQAILVWNHIDPASDGSTLYRDKIIRHYKEEGMIFEIEKLYKRWYDYTLDDLDGLNAAGFTLHRSPEKALAILRGMNSRKTQNLIPIIEKIQNNEDKVDSLNLWLLGAEQFRREGAYSAAEAAAKKVLEDDNRNQAAWLELGIIKLLSGRDGTDAIQKGLSLAPTNIGANMKAAEYWLLGDQPDIALVYLQQAKLMDPDNEQVLTALGEVQLAEGLTEEGLENLVLAAEQSPGKPEPWLRVAKYTLEHHDQLSEIGISAARKAVLADGNKPEGYDILGQIYLVVGDVVNAEKMLRKSVQIDPGYTDGAIHLSMVLVELGKAEEAKVILLTAMEQSTDPNGHKLLRDRLATLD